MHVPPAAPGFYPAVPPTSPNKIAFELTGMDAVGARGGTDGGWLWHGFLAPGNLTLLTSQWKTGKTTLASVLLARMGTGGTLGGLPVRSGRTVIVSEEHLSLWAMRQERLHMGSHVHLMSRPFGGRPTPAEWSALID